MANIVKILRSMWRMMERLTLSRILITRRNGSVARWHLCDRLIKFVAQPTWVNCEESAWSPRADSAFKLLAKSHSVVKRIGVFRRRNSRETMKSFAVRACLAFSVIALSFPAVWSSKTRTYFIAAVERKWDYAPSGYNKVKGVKLENDR